MSDLQPLTWSMRGGDMHPQAFLDWLPYCALAAEIGVYSGELSELLLQSGKVGTLVCVDDWKDRGHIHSCYDHMRDVEYHFDHRMKRFGDRCVKVKASSDVAARVLRSAFDLVYIDTTHDYLNASQDIETWAGRADILAGHDYHAYVGVTQAVNEWCGGRPDHLFPDTTWVRAHVPASDIGPVLDYLKRRFPEPKLEG